MVKNRWWFGEEGPTPSLQEVLAPPQSDPLVWHSNFTINFLDISVDLLWFQSKNKVSVFAKQKLWPHSLKKKILNQHLIMRVKIVAYKFTVNHYHSHVHYYYTQQNMLNLPWEDNSLAPKWNNKQKKIVSLINLQKKFTYNLIPSLQTNHMSGSIKG